MIVELLAGKIAIKPTSIDLDYVYTIWYTYYGGGYMVKNISTRKLRENLAGVIKDVKTNFDRYIVSRRGEPEAILMSIDDYESWLETIEIMSDKKLMDDIRLSEKEIKDGKVYTFEEVFGKKPHKSGK